MSDAALIPDGFLLDDDVSSPEVTKRGNILPFAEYSDGSAGLAVPAFIHDPIAAFSQLLARGGYSPGTQDEEGVRLATQAAGGAMAGSMAAARPAASLGAGGRVVPKDVISWAQRAGVPIEKVETAKTGSTYVKVRDPNAASDAPGARVNIRVAPEDGHGGRILPRDVKAGNYFDTTPEAPRKEFPRIMAPRVNEGGGMYSEWDNLEAALKWRTSRSPDGQFLIPPDKAPRSLREGPPPRSVTPKTAEGADMSPEQLKLLSGGIPFGFVMDDDAPRADVWRWLEGSY